MFQQKIPHLEIPLIFSILWVWHLKTDLKSKKWSECVKNDAKAGIT